MSVLFIPAAPTEIRTSPSAGSGVGTSSRYSSFSRPPWPVSRTAFMAYRAPQSDADYPPALRGFADRRCCVPLRKSSLPALRSGASSHPDHHVLDLCVVLQSLESPLSPDAALLVAAERRPRAAREVLVDHDVACLDVSREPHRAIDVGCKDSGRQAVVRVVGDLGRLLLGREGQDRQHRTEYLLPGDAHLAAHAIEYGRGDEVSPLELARAAPDDQVRALVPSRFHVAHDAVEMFGGDEGPHIRVFHAGAERYLPGVPDNVLHQGFANALLHQQPGAGVAVLAGVGVDALHDLARGAVQVAVGEDDLGDLPPSSRTTGFTCSADARMTARPVSTDPVKVIEPIPGCSLRTLPASAPKPVTTL